MSMKIRSLKLALALAITPVTVAAQSATAQNKAAAESNVAAQGSGEAQARINAAIEQALSVGIPVSMLESKVAEGRAKGVSMTRIAAAVEHRLDVLTTAQSAIAARGAATSHAELAAAASAIDAGAEIADVQEVRGSAKPEQRPAALSLLAELIAEGNVPAQAVKGVQTAIAAQSAALLRLQGQSAAGLGLGIGADARGTAGAEAAKGAGVTLKGLGKVKAGRGN